MKIFLFVPYFFWALLLLGCGNKKTPPSFAVAPLEGSSVGSFSVTSSMFAAVIACENELQYLNDAPETLGRAPGSVGTINRAVDYLQAGYAEALFWDCEARRQVLEEVGNGAEVTSTSDIQSLLVTSEHKGKPPEDFTRFISWEGDYDDSDSRGKMVNQLLQYDGTHYKVRLDLSKQGNLKTLDSTMVVQINDGTDQWFRSWFREISESEHYVTSRYHDTDDNIIVVAVGHFVEGVGSSSFYSTCPNRSFNDVCTLGATPTALYLDEDGNEYPGPTAETDASTDGLITLTNLSTLTSVVPNLDLFYTGPEAAFFDPVFE